MHISINIYIKLFYPQITDKDVSETGQTGVDTTIVSGEVDTSSTNIPFSTVLNVETNDGTEPVSLYTEAIHIYFCVIFSNIDCI